MGILRLAAIPAVSRTIENSRRDTYVDVVKTYINTVRNAVLADELECILEGETDATSVGAVPNGTYYFKLGTNSAYDGYQQIKDIMESGGLSSWSNADVAGYVKWIKKSSASQQTGETKTTTDYFALLVDKGNHGMDDEHAEKDITRSKIKTKTEKTVDGDTKFEYPKDSEDNTKDAIECTLK